MVNFQIKKQDSLFDSHFINDLIQRIFKGLEKLGGIEFSKKSEDIKDKYNLNMSLMGYNDYIADVALVRGHSLRKVQSAIKNIIESEKNFKIVSEQLENNILVVRFNENRAFSMAPETFVFVIYCLFEGSNLEEFIRKTLKNDGAITYPLNITVAKGRDINGFPHCFDLLLRYYLELDLKNKEQIYYLADENKVYLKEYLDGERPVYFTQPELESIFVDSLEKIVSSEESIDEAKLYDSIFTELRNSNSFTDKAIEYLDQNKIRLLKELVKSKFQIDLEKPDPKNNSINLWKFLEKVTEDITKDLKEKVESFEAEQLSSIPKDTEMFKQAYVAFYTKTLQENIDKVKETIEAEDITKDDRANIKTGLEEIQRSFIRDLEGFFDEGNLEEEVEAEMEEKEIEQREVVEPGEPEEIDRVLVNLKQGDKTYSILRTGYNKFNVGVLDSVNFSIENTEISGIRDLRSYLTSIGASSNRAESVLTSIRGD